MPEASGAVRGLDLLQTRGSLSSTNGLGQRHKRQVAKTGNWTQKPLQSERSWPILGSWVRPRTEDRAS